MKINIKKLDERATLPTYATEGSSGFDFAAIERVEIRPGVPRLIRTGIAMEIPLGYELQIRSRSSLALKTKLRIAPGIGTVDSDYREEIFIMLENTDPDGKAFVIAKGDRIAQGVIVPVLKVELTEVTELTETSRTGGFGSTGR